jgi:hypothetical protein
MMLERILNKRLSGLLWICGSVAFSLASLGFCGLGWAGALIILCVCGAAILPTVALLKGDPFAVWIVRVEAILVFLLFTWWIWRRAWFVDVGTLIVVCGSLWVFLGLSYKSHAHTS